MNLARMVDCLSPELCAEILDEYKHFDFVRAVTINKNGGSTKTSGRTNSQVRLPSKFEDAAHEQFNAALLSWSTQIKQEYPDVYDQMQLPGVTIGLETTREPLMLLRYQKTEQYRYHVDAPLYSYTHDGLDLQNRLISVVAYINDDFKGGETEMHHRKYKPAQGKALIFPSNWNYPHRSCPVTEGEKLAIVTWFHPRP